MTNHSLLQTIFKQAKYSRLLRGARSTSVDATGMETRHISKYYKKRRKECKRHTAINYPKLNIACDNDTHLIIAADVTLGPSQDSPQFGDLILDSHKLIKIKQVLADKGNDSEFNHTLCRDFLSIKESIIPTKRKNAWNRKWPKTNYRRKMKKNFPSKKYGQRWQVESVFSRLKRKFGSYLNAKKWEYQINEIVLKVLMYNLAIIAV